MSLRPRPSAKDGDGHVGDVTSRFKNVLALGYGKNAKQAVPTERLFKDYDTFLRDNPHLIADDDAPLPRDAGGNQFLPRVPAMVVEPQNAAEIAAYFAANPGGQDPPVRLAGTCPLCLSELDDISGGTPDDYVPPADGSDNRYKAIEVILDGPQSSGQIYFAECLFNLILTEGRYGRQPRDPITRQPIPTEVIDRVMTQMTAAGTRPQAAQRAREVAADDYYKQVYNANILQRVAKYIQDHVRDDNPYIELDELYNTALTKAGRPIDEDKWLPSPRGLYPDDEDNRVNTRQAIYLDCLNRTQVSMQATLIGFTDDLMIDPPPNYAVPPGWGRPVLQQERETAAAAGAAAAAAAAAGGGAAAAGAAAQAAAAAQLVAGAPPAVPPPAPPVAARDIRRKTDRNGDPSPFMGDALVNRITFRQIDGDIVARRMHYRAMGTANLRNLLWHAYWNRLTARRLRVNQPGVVAGSDGDVQVVPYTEYYHDNMQEMFVGPASEPNDDVFWQTMLTPGGTRAALRRRTNDQFVRPFLDRLALIKFPDNNPDGSVASYMITQGRRGPFTGADRRREFVQTQVAHNKYLSPLVGMFAMFASPPDLRIFNFQFPGGAAEASAALLDRLVAFAAMSYPEGSGFNRYQAPVNPRRS